MSDFTAAALHAPWARFAGKSRSFFYFSSDSKYMVKTIGKEEHQVKPSPNPMWTGALPWAVEVAACHTLCSGIANRQLPLI